MLSALDLVYEQRAEAQQQMRTLLAFSALAHLGLVLALTLAPGPSPLRVPPALTVNLLAALPSPAPSPAAAPAPAAPARQKARILPKQAPPAAAKPKPKPAPKPAPVLQRRARPEELAYDDALAKLRGELGEKAPSPVAQVPAAPPKARADAAPSPQGGVRVAPELLAWHLAVKRHVREGWITPPEFRESGLVAELVIDVAADGSLLGRPKLVASSGNAFYDDNAVRALVRADPLPPPPRPGPQTIVFTPEE